MAVAKGNCVAVLSTIFQWFGLFCSRSPVEILVVWLTTFACFLTLGLYELSLIPNFKDLDSNLVRLEKVNIF